MFDYIIDLTMLRDCENFDLTDLHAPIIIHLDNNAVAKHRCITEYFLCMALLDCAIVIEAVLAQRLRFITHAHLDCKVAEIIPCKIKVIIPVISTERY